MKHKDVAKKIRERVLILRRLFPEIVIFDGMNIFCNGKRNEEKYKEMLKIYEDQDLPEQLFAKGFASYIGSDMDDYEVFIGQIKGKTRHYKNGYLNGYPNLTKGFRITNLDSKMPIMYRITKEHPMHAATYGGESAIIVGLMHDIALPLLDYVDDSVKWRYNPESNAYYDGSERSKENLNKIVKSLEYILINLNLK